MAEESGSRTHQRPLPGGPSRILKSGRPTAGTHLLLSRAPKAWGRDVSQPPRSAVSPGGEERGKLRHCCRRRIDRRAIDVLCAQSEITHGRPYPRQQSSQQPARDRHRQYRRLRPGEPSSRHVELQADLRAGRRGTSRDRRRDRSADPPDRRGRSSGAATDDAIVVGSAPGKAAPTETVGKSTLGRAARGSWLNPMIPASRMAAMISEVAIGRSTKVLEKFIGRWPTGHCCPSGAACPASAYRPCCPFAGASGRRPRRARRRRAPWSPMSGRRNPGPAR